MPQVHAKEPLLAKAAGAVLLRAPVRKKDVELIHTAVDIASIEPSASDIGFLPAVFCQVTLPRSNAIGPVFLRRQGKVELRVLSSAAEAVSEWVPVHIPSGSLARLVLIFVTTQAVQHQSAGIVFGESAAQFLRALGRGSNGGQRGSYVALHKQMQALDSCYFQIKYLDQQFEGFLFEQDESRYKATKKTDGWSNERTLHKDFARMVLAGSVPLDMRAVRALGNCPFSLDVYVWLTHRLCRVRGEQFVSWECLYEQFGGEFKGVRPHNDFKKCFKKALDKARLVYPKAKIIERAAGLVLIKSPPPVPVDKYAN